MSDAAAAGPVLAADGRPLKRSLNRALRRQKIRALMLIAPLFFFILITFIAPIADMLFRSVENGIVEETLPQVVPQLEDWDAASGEPPDEATFRSLYYDLAVASAAKQHTQLGNRLNYESSGFSSLFRQAGRGVDDIGEHFMDQFTDVNGDLDEAEVWVAAFAAPEWYEAQAAWTRELRASEVAAAEFSATNSRSAAEDITARAATITPDDIAAARTAAEEATAELEAIEVGTEEYVLASGRLRATLDRPDRLQATVDGVEPAQSRADGAEARAERIRTEALAEGITEAEIAAAPVFFSKPEPALIVIPAVAEAFPQTTGYYAEHGAIVQADEDSLMDEEPEPYVFTSLYEELIANPAAVDAIPEAARAPFAEAAAAVGGFEALSFREAMIDVNDDWGSPDLWSTIRTFSSSVTSGYFLTAFDLRLTPDGIERQPEDRQIYVTLFIRTLVMSLVIMGFCILLGYPVSYLLATTRPRTANLLMILVLLPFWTSLLVRTSAWKVLLQQQGVINDILVWYHGTWLGQVLDPIFTNALTLVVVLLNVVTWIVTLPFRIFGSMQWSDVAFSFANDGFERLSLINNQTGTIIAMTHILLPFMILPMYSVMKTIPPTYVRAAKSLGATPSTAFWRVYFPQSIPGIGAGSILVFILAIGYYITPAIVGGTKGIFISNRIALEFSQTLNWGLAAALGAILLVVVLVLYWVYDRMVGIDNVKLGG